MKYAEIQKYTKTFFFFFVVIILLESGGWTQNSYFILEQHAGLVEHLGGFLCGDVSSWSCPSTVFLSFGYVKEERKNIRNLSAYQNDNKTFFLKKTKNKKQLQSSKILYSEKSNMAFIHWNHSFM